MSRQGMRLRLLGIKLCIQLPNFRKRCSHLCYLGLREDGKRRFHRLEILMDHILSSSGLCGDLSNGALIYPSETAIAVAVAKGASLVNEAKVVLSVLQKARAVEEVVARVLVLREVQVRAHNGDLAKVRVDGHRRLVFVVGFAQLVHIVNHARVLDDKARDCEGDHDVGL